MKIVATAAISLAFLSACASHVLDESTPFFPKVAPPHAGTEQVMLTAAFRGEPIVERGCVKVRSPGSSSATTVLWYQGAELGRDAQGLFLRDQRSSRMVRFNEPANFGGGSAPSEYVERAYPEVARRCGGPYAFGYLGDPHAAP